MLSIQFYYMKFQVGDTVSILDEPLKGKVMSVGTRIKVLLEDGFEETYLPSQLSIFSKNMLEIPLDIKDSVYSSEIKVPKIAEIDLHFDAQRMKIHQIESNEILNRQLQLLGEEIRESMAHKVDQLIVIHGIGKGILKNEVIQLSKKFPKITVRTLTESRYKNCAIALDFDYL